LEKLLPLDLKNVLKMTVSVHLLSDGWIWFKHILLQYNITIGSCTSSKNLDCPLHKIFKTKWVFVHFLIDGWMDSKDVWYTDVSWRDAGQVRI
jgi:hypothetical protein